MSTRIHPAPLAALHAHQKAQRHARRRRRPPGSPGLAADAQHPAWQAQALAARYPVGHFGPQHGLTIEQAWLANQLLDRANRRQPLTDLHRYNLRLAGIISSIRGGRVGNARWGRQMLARRGGLAMARHAPHILKANREQIRQQQAWDAHVAQQTPLDEQIEQWQQEQWRPKNFLAW
jgi:hypothetical protein